MERNRQDNESYINGSHSSSRVKEPNTVGVDLAAIAIRLAKGETSITDANGNVTTKGAGEATLTANCGTMKKTIKVTVTSKDKSNTLVYSIKITKDASKVNIIPYDITYREILRYLSFCV